MIKEREVKDSVGKTENYFLTFRKSNINVGLIILLANRIQQSAQLKLTS